MGFGKSFKKAVKKVGHAAGKAVKKTAKTVGNAITGGAMNKAKAAKEKAKKEQAALVRRNNQIRDNAAQAQRAENQNFADMSGTERGDTAALYETNITGTGGDGAPAEFKKKRLLGA